MQVKMRFKDLYTTRMTYGALGFILTSDEIATMHSVMRGFYYSTDVSPAVVLDTFQKSGIEFEDFESIEFRP